MDFEAEIRNAVRRAIMEEINGLALRATLREKIEAAGVTDEDIKSMMKETADSYFRSAMNGNVEAQIQEYFEREVKETVKKEIKDVIGPYGGLFGRESVRKALDEAVAQEIRKGFDVSVTINQKQ